jgi:hypothetical protein
LKEWPDQAKWRRHFEQIITSGDPAEIDVATEAAVHAIRQGATDVAAQAVGAQAAMGYRNAAAARTATSPFASDQARVQTTERPAWPATLAARLFAIPPRWGWAPATVAATEEPPPPLAAPAPRPAWAEPPRPDTKELVRARSTAVTKLVWRIGFMIVLAVAFLSYRLAITSKVQTYGNSATQVYTIAVAVVGAILLISLIRAIGRVGFASRAIREFEQPYLQLRAAERQRHEQAVAEWEAATRRHEQPQTTASFDPSGPLWFPVRPAHDPARVDVLGGDPGRHGWASMLVTAGTSALASGRQVTVLDMSGQDVAGGLLSVAKARGLDTRRVDLPEDGGYVDLLADVPQRELPDALARVLTDRPDGQDARHERALAADIISRLISSLDPPLTFRRLAAGVQVLRQATPEADVLSVAESTRLAEHVGEFGRDEWTGKQLHLAVRQLTMLGDISPGRSGQALWSGAACTVVTTDGIQDDRTSLADRLLVQLADRAMRPGGKISGLLVVADADHLGAVTLQQLSDHARLAGVELMLMIDQTQGDLEKTLGTGGVVCVMKAFNHKDAGIAADFIGRDHKFVVSQVTRQVGKTFTDGGGDNFAAATNRGTSAKGGLIRERGRNRDLTNSRGHTWTAARNWSTADNLSDSQTATRVYEFTVDPQQILGMPETAFILVDNTGSGRRVVMADCYPGICLLDRVALTPAPDLGP